MKISLFPVSDASIVGEYFFLMYGHTGGHYHPIENVCGRRCHVWNYFLLLYIPYKSVIFYVFDSIQTPFSIKVVTFGHDILIHIKLESV